MAVDVHQHLWPEVFLEALRRRRTPPHLDGWTLLLDGEPPYDVRASDHDVTRRAARAAEQGTDLALVSLSSPLGIEHLAPDDAAPLLAAYHDGVAALPARFRSWAAAQVTEPDAAAVAALLERGFVGLQLPATALGDPSGWERCAPLLDVCERAGAPLFVHPGPARPVPGTPGWWPAMTDYVEQMQRAWYAFRVVGRPQHPGLRVCFAMLAGLAPLHGERFAARAEPVGPVDRDAFVETSSYGPVAVAATVQVLGPDVVVRGSDAPYAEPPDNGTAAHSIGTANPARLLGRAVLSCAESSTPAPRAPGRSPAERP
jgi:predicted TIM-barrel fold metal-dependent hydrolase